MPALGFIFVLLGSWSERLLLVALGFAAMVPWIFLIMSKWILIFQKHIPSAGLTDSCASLARLGILQAHNESYRFRHQELSQKLAREVLVDLCDKGELGHLLYPEAANALTDGRLTAQALAKDASLTKSAVEECGRFASVVVGRTLTSTTAHCDSACALPPLQLYASQLPDTELRALIAEVLGALGRRAEAWEIWQEATGCCWIRPGFSTVGSGHSYLLEIRTVPQRHFEEDWMSCRQKARHTRNFCSPRCSVALGP